MVVVVFYRFFAPLALWEFFSTLFCYVFMNFLPLKFFSIFPLTFGIFLGGEGYWNFMIGRQFGVT